MSESDALGSALRAAREEQGLSVPDVASALKVPVAVVSNIEDEQFDALPARVFTRAYIRSFAELVGLGPDALLWAYDQKANPEMAEQVETRRSITVLGVMAAFARDLKLHRRQSWVFGGTVVLFAALAALFLWFAWPSDAPDASSPAEEQTRAPAGDAAEPAASADVASVPAPNGASASEPFAWSEAPAPVSPPVPVLDGAPGGTWESASGARPTSPADGLPVSASTAPGEEPLVALSNPLTYVPGDDQVLAFRFTQDCWVKVLDASGAFLHGDLERAGDVLEVRGEAPFTLTLGYAPGVQLDYNGERIMLAQHTNESNVAELVLGL